MSNVANEVASRWVRRAYGGVVNGILVLFLANIALLILAVAIDSLASRWLGTWLPEGWTFSWYRSAYTEFQLVSVLRVTAEVVIAVVVLSIAFGVPTAYVLARRTFRGKRALMLLFLVPLMVPPITYGIPLATLMYKVGIAGTLPGVVLANMIPTVPFVILVMTPFIEQIDPALESAARVFGAGTGRMLLHVLVPLIAPGILAASLLVLVRVMAMFELTFLVAGPESQTLVVALYYAVFAAGIRAPQSVDAMAMVYMLATLIWLAIALRFINPTQLVSRVKAHPEHA